MDKRALFITQLPLHALALYRAARLDVAVVFIGSHMPIDSMILRLKSKCRSIYLPESDTSSQEVQMFKKCPRQ